MLLGIKHKMVNEEFHSVSRKIPGPKGKKVIEEFEKYKAPGLSLHPPVVWEKANGAIVQDIDGNKYVDFTSGIAVANVGHCSPLVVKAVKEQVEKLINCYDYPTSINTMLLRELSEICPTDLKGDTHNRVQLLTGGSEGVEMAIKLSKHYTGKTEVITTQGGFHGRAALLALSLTGEIKYRKGYGPMVPGILHVPYAYCYRCPFEKKYPDCNLFCTKYFERVINYESTGDIAAFILEPVQGAAGYIVPPDEYLIRVKEFCEKYNILMIDDEIQSGFGRTGKFFAIEHSGVKPDIMLLGKGIASGIPMTAVVAREEIFNSMKPGEHSSTYGGNPVSCAAALATIEEIKSNDLIKNAKQLGEHIKDRLLRMKEKHKLIGDVRGRGLMIGVELVTDQKTKTPATEEVKIIRQKICEKGLLMVTAGLWGSVLRIAPPLVITKKLADIGVDILDEAIGEVEHKI